MIPWVEAHLIHLGPVSLQVWGTFVAAGFFVATWIAARRARTRGLDAAHVWDAAFWIFIAAFIGSRAVHIFLYEPGYYRSHSWEALDPTAPGYAIIGGIIAGVAALYFFCRRKGLNFLAYADTLAWGVPWGCGIGRIGCFLIHDHPGTLTSFILGVKYPDGSTRHDLGLYLSLTGFTIGGLFLLLNRRPRQPGFWVGSFFVFDSVIRFVLDFLRVADRRFFFLTPTQWIVIPFFAIGLWLVARRRV